MHRRPTSSCRLAPTRAEPPQQPPAHVPRARGVRSARTVASRPPRYSRLRLQALAFSTPPAKLVKLRDAFREIDKVSRGEGVGQS